tara:strand:+ start:2474 stop:2692 length:219 start_codon:yes stop_codon:yes gene_type:complete
MSKPIKPIFISNDPLVRRVLERMSIRGEEGIEKYGVTMEDANKPVPQWIDDAQEELWDAILYLEKIKQSFIS